MPAKNGQTKMQALRDVIGDRGENIFELAITDFREFDRPLFKPGFLGDKWPTIDFYVELLGVRGSKPYFFVQVKSTVAALNEGNATLSIQASKKKCTELFSIPGPTYIAGIHEPTRRAFIQSLHTRPNQGIYQIPLRFELIPENLSRLHQEVRSFWQSAPHKPTESYFL